MTLQRTFLALRGGVVTAAGGRIAVVSALGEGSAFTVFLPTRGRTE